MLKLNPWVRPKVICKFYASLRVNFISVINQGWVLFRVRKNSVSELLKLNQASLLKIDFIEKTIDVVNVEVCKAEVKF